jgi:crotonobetainyl-CoA:carnitine CoA-transferase CaiB-like acyl-CoA transferase
MVAPVPRLSATPGRIRDAGREKGADNDAVFGSLLGMSAQEMARLVEKGVM